MLLVVRADANSRIGAGHVMRCLALAQAWDGPVRFISREPPDWVRARLGREGFAVVEADDFTDASWVLVDGYHFTADYLRSIPAPVVFFDDVPRLAEYPVRLVWNPNISAPTSYGSTPALLGPAYYPLRREFWPYAGRPLTVPAVARKLLITMGGADPPGFTAVALEAARSHDFELRVVVGGSNPARASLACRLGSEELVEDAEDMASVLAWTDLALSAAGVTSYELAFLGVPTLLVVLADNQLLSAQGFAAAGAARNLGELPSRETLTAALQALAHDHPARQALSSAGRELVDGRGVTRVIGTLKGDSLAACEHSRWE